MHDDVIAKYQALTKRLHEWIKPLIRAHYRRDQAAAEAALKAAHAEVDAAGLDADELAAVRLHLLYIEYHTVLQVTVDKWQRPQYEALYTKLQEPQPGPISEFVRQTRLLILQIEAEHDGLIVFAPEDFERLYNSIQPRKFNRVVNHYIGTWAFMHNRLDILTETLEHLVTAGGKPLADYIWHRLHLMQRLLTQTAEKRDVQELLNWINHPYVLIEFRHLLLEPCRRAGLIDAAIEEELARKERVLKYTDSGMV
ncbi:hypothetical protein JW859_09005 [bacterium]|nr:hypothetical protein [bacterium]